MSLSKLQKIRKVDHTHTIAGTCVEKAQDPLRSLRRREKFQLESNCVSFDLALRRVRVPFENNMLLKSKHVSWALIERLIVF